jgi:hypothetical protein
MHCVRIDATMLEVIKNDHHARDRNGSCNKKCSAELQALHIGCVKILDEESVARYGEQGW